MGYILPSTDKSEEKDAQKQGSAFYSGYDYFKRQSVKPIFKTTYFFSSLALPHPIIANDYVSIVEQICWPQSKELLLVDLLTNQNLKWFLTDISFIPQVTVALNF